MAQGHVERAPDPGDRRRNVVSITRAGDRQLRRLDRAIEQVQEELLEPLSPAERTRFTGLLNRLLDHHGGVTNH